MKAWAAKTLPTLEDHLKMARDTNGAVGTSGTKTPGTKKTCGNEEVAAALRVLTAALADADAAHSLEQGGVLDKPHRAAVLRARRINSFDSWVGSGVAVMTSSSTCPSSNAFRTLSTPTDAEAVGAVGVHQRLDPFAVGLGVLLPQRRHRRVEHLVLRRADVQLQRCRRSFSSRCFGSCSRSSGTNHLVAGEKILSSASSRTIRSTASTTSFACCRWKFSVWR